MGIYSIFWRRVTAGGNSNEIIWASDGEFKLLSVFWEKQIPRSNVWLRGCDRGVVRLNVGGICERRVAGVLAPNGRETRRARLRRGVRRCGYLRIRGGGVGGWRRARG